MEDQMLDFQTLLPEEAATLVATVGRIVPHPQEPLQRTVFDTAKSIDAQLVGDLEFRSLIKSGLADLDQRSNARAGRVFSDLGTDDQVEILHEVEGSTFFQRLINATVSDFYNRHVVWEALGYPGMARKRDLQGYIDRGFDQLDW